MCDRSVLVFTFFLQQIKKHQNTTMKKTTILTACLLVTTITYSQVRYGLQVSLNQSTANIEGKNFASFTQDIQKLKGVMAVAEIPISKHISLRSSLGYLQKGAELYPQTNTPGNPMNNYFHSLSTTLSYLELPTSINYNININPLTISVGAGPSFGYGLSGKVRAMFLTQIPGAPVVETTTEEDAFKPEEKDGAGFKRFETSADLLLSVRHKSGLYLSANYLHGLTDLTSGEEKYKSKNLFFSLGFMF
jgi:hypothetical protein